MGPFWILIVYIYVPQGLEFVKHSSVSRDCLCLHCTCIFSFRILGNLPFDQGLSFVLLDFSTKFQNQLIKSTYLHSNRKLRAPVPD